ncbi:hypothetical protein PRK78_006667 [Emydomyces testavorans]|uniref:Peptidase metallopeptidase domain-containing protein n=1 Tax=Emydomyces testavorans TaxID=2070801 RepID=A0AAF0DNW0_9EURO|nr:hypothetical protein PRK78_006667 [Emydomyces testavorans]
MARSPRSLYLFIYVAFGIACICHATSLRNVSAVLKPRSISAIPDFRWPNGEVIYCFEKTKGDALEKLFNAGWAIWERKAGFFIKRRKLASCDEERHIRGAVLHVLETNTSPSCTVGMRQKCQLKFNPNFKGASKDLPVTMAHELGHAFGLFHEHQKPGAGKHIRFNCENLSDYDKIKKKEPQQIGELCSERARGENAGFSASHLLPLVDMDARWYKLDDPGDDNSPDYIDWKSIMIYGSKFGGKKVVTGFKWARQPVMTRSDGSLIEANTEPSDRDIRQLQWLYNAPIEKELEPII